MERLRGAGGTVGEYAGDGQGEAESAIVIPEAVGDPVDADPGFDCEQSEEDEDGNGDESGSDDSHPLLILFDCETTGLSAYSDHITDIGAKVIASPVTPSVPTFSSLVRTPRKVPAAGKIINKKERERKKERKSKNVLHI